MCKRKTSDEGQEPTVGREGESWGLDVEKRQPCRNPKIKYFQKTHEPRILKLRTSLVCSRSRRGQSGWRIVNKGKDGGRQVEEKERPSHRVCRVY